MSARDTDASRYRRLSLLGEGGVGQVWLVEDRLRPGERFALKESAKSEPRHADILRREFALLARLRHPGIVEAFDLDFEPPEHGPAFTLEFVEGESLQQAVRREGASFCLEMAAEALRVVAFLHDFDLIHCDLKPANLLVRKRERLGCRLVLLDLGLAVSGAHEPAGRKTGPVGTLPYLAPEQFDGAPPSPRSDLYSLGAMFYEVLHGRPPHLPGGKELSAFVEAVRQGKRPRPPVPSGYPDGLSEWIEELLAPDPASRPAGAREALARLNAACGTEFPAETAASRAARIASDPPVGRDNEFGAIWSMLDTSAGPRVVLLAGPAGIGKSRLLRWLRTEAILRDWLVLVPDRREVDPGAFLQQVRAHADAQPTLLLLDEIEAAGSRTLQFVDRIAREGRAAPVQVVVAVRPGEATHPVLRRLLEDIGTVPTLRRVDISALDDAGIRALAQRATGSRAPAGSRLRWLSGTSEGIPLLAEALLVEGAWEKGRGDHRSKVLERSARARLNLLSAHGKAWLEALSVLHGNVLESTIAALAGLGEPEARQAAEEARVTGLARMEQGRWSPDSRSVAASVLDALDEDRRFELHKEAAELLLSEGGNEADSWQLATLWSAAGERGRARDCAVQAADQALRDGAPEVAAERFGLALRACARDDPARLDLRVRQAAARATAGLHQAAARAYGGALRLAGDRPERASLLARQAQALVESGRFARARKVAQEALALSTAHGLTLERARAHKVLGMVLARLGQEADALPVLEEALALARREGDLQIEAEALQIMAACKARLQREDAEADFLQVIELQRKLGESRRELRSLVGLAVIQMRAGKLDRAGQLLEDAQRRAAEHGHLDLLETAVSKLASLATEQGRLDRALSLAHEAMDQAQHLGDQNRLMINRCRLAEALIGCGRPAEAADLLREALKEALDKVEPDMADSARMLLAHALLETRQAADADIAPLLERALAGFRSRRKTRDLLMALVIEMERRARSGVRDPFEPVHMEFEALAAGSALDLEPEIRLRSELARGAYLLRRGNPPGARDEAHSASRIARSANLTAYEAQAHGLLGEALEQIGSADEAEQAFARGVELLDTAAKQIADADTRRSFLNRALFRTLRSRRPVPAENEKRLVALYDMIRALNSESDPDALLETMLEMALRAVTAERGMVLLREPPTSDSFSVHVARNLERETQKDAEDFSRSIVAEAGAGRSILALDAGEDVRFRDLRSVSLYGIRSLMCVPLRSRETVIGTVYLDSRQPGSLFTPQDLRFIEAFADHAALALQNARERADLRVENERLKTAAEGRVRFGELIGRSPSMQRVFHLIEKVAGSNLPVLIHGDSGTGKELVARAIHFHSARKRKIFLSENCAAIPESLLESELFGHVKGAFTGADRTRHGLFEQADGGTLFLDEVGDMPHSMQAKLLRVLQEGEIRRVGGEHSIPVDVRVLTATHQDLLKEVGEERFREDLLYRLQVLQIDIAPLRERPEDIAPLIDHLLGRISGERGRPAPPLSREVQLVLERHDWPGNVRQLENTLQRLALLAGDDPISTATVRSDDSMRRTLLGETPEAAMPVFSLRDAARDQLKKALSAAGGDRLRAAKLLGVSRATIYRKIRDLGLNDPS